MRKSYHLALPILGLAVWLGLMVLVASEGYHIQQLNAEWVEFVEYWVDQRQEAVENLDEYLHNGNESEYREYQKAANKVLLYTRAATAMISDTASKQRAHQLLAEKVGFDSKESRDLIWHARHMRSWLGIEQDYRKWGEAVRQWKKLEELANDIHKAFRGSGAPSENVIAGLKKRLNKFIKTSRTYDSEIQSKVEMASKELKFWSNVLTILLAFLLFLAGSLLIGVIYRNARQNQKKFRTLFDNSPDGIVIADANGRILNFNDSFKQLFGYAEDEIVGRNLDSLLTQTGAEQKEAEQLSKRLRQKEIYSGEVVRYDKDGNAIPVLLSAVPVVLQEKVEFYYAIYIDISEQKRLEEKNRKLLERERTLRAKAEESRERFKEMFEKAPSAIALLEGPDFEYVYTNKLHRELTGKNAVGSTVREMFPEFKQQGLIETLEQVYESGEVYEGREEPIEVEIEGETVTYYRDYVYIPLKNEKGETYAIFIDSVDVTDQVKYQRQLQEELEEKTTLLEEIHHRVKNNLASITGILQLQLYHIEDEQAREALIDSELRIHTLADIHELLYESKRLSEINMESYINKLVGHIKKVSTQTDHVTTEIDVEPFTLSIKQAQPLALMLNEILQNAYKHAFPGNRSGQLKIAAREENDTVHLKIQDNGVGMNDSDKMERGLGMELVENIQKQLEADIDIDTSEGTCYTIEFKKK